LLNIAKATMNLEELREYCLSKTGAEETLPFGPDTLVFKVHGKAFVLTGFENSPLRFNVKCDPEKAIELREQYSCVLPGYHMNKKHWNTIVADGTAGKKLLRQWIDQSYDLVLASLPAKNRKKPSSKK
jgi:predicted DNA-binding protein (MmcQ/YjbR family)